MCFLFLEISCDQNIHESLNTINEKVKECFDKVEENSSKVAIEPVSIDLVKSKKSNYVPAYRSGGYAILCAMFEKSQEDGYKGNWFYTNITSLLQNFN